MAAITLRDSSGRDRKQAVRSLAATWKVARYEKVCDKLKDRSVSAMATDVEAAVCDAASTWERDQQGAASQRIDAGSNSRMDDDVAVKRAKTISAADHLLAAAKHTNATVRALPETLNHTPPGDRYVQG